MPGELPCSPTSQRASDQEELEARATPAVWLYTGTRAGRPRQGTDEVGEDSIGASAGAQKVGRAFQRRTRVASSVTTVVNGEVEKGEFYPSVRDNDR